MIDDVAWCDSVGLFGSGDDFPNAVTDTCLNIAVFYRFKSALHRNYTKFSVTFHVDIRLLDVLGLSLN